MSGQLILTRGFCGGAGSRNEITTTRSASILFWLFFPNQLKLGRSTTTTRKRFYPTRQFCNTKSPNQTNEMASSAVGKKENRFAPAVTPPANQQVTCVCVWLTWQTFNCSFYMWNVCTATFPDISLFNLAVCLRTIWFGFLLWTINYCAFLTLIFVSWPINDLILFHLCRLCFLPKSTQLFRRERSFVLQRPAQVGIHWNLNEFDSDSLQSCPLIDEHYLKMKKKWKSFEMFWSTATGQPFPATRAEFHSRWEPFRRSVCRFPKQ